MNLLSTVTLDICFDLFSLLCYQLWWYFLLNVLKISKVSDGNLKFKGQITYKKCDYTGCSFTPQVKHEGRGNDLLGSGNVSRIQADIYLNIKIYKYVCIKCLFFCWWRKRMCKNKRHILWNIYFFRFSFSHRRNSFTIAQDDELQFTKHLYQIFWHISTHINVIFA